MPQLDIALYLPQLFWLGVFFSLLFLSIYFFIEPRFQKILQERTRSIDEKLEEINRLKKEAEVFEIQALEVERQTKEEIKKLICSAENELDVKIHHKKDEQHRQILQEIGRLDKELEENQRYFLKELETQEKFFLEKIIRKITENPKQ